MVSNAKMGRSAQLKYRYYQLLMDTMIEPFIPIMAVIFGFCIALCILTLTVAIKFHNMLGPITTLGFTVIGPTLIFAMYYAVIFHTRTRNISLTIFKKVVRTKYDKTFARSCRPIQFNIGHFYSIKSSTFFLNIVSFIIGNTANLLVIYEELFS